MLQVQNITKIFGELNVGHAIVALDDIEFSVAQGEFIAIMGPSGSGKTTLLNMISGIDTPTAGKVLIGDVSLHELSKEEQALYRRRKIGFVFQDYNLLHSLSLKDNILLPMILEKRTVEEMEKKFAELSELFGITELAHNYPHEVSGGQKQRAAICRALINEPAIIFADEPTGNLDSKNAAVLMENLRLIVEKLHTTVLLVTHDVFAASYCQKVLFIKDGALHSSAVRKESQQAFLQNVIDCMTLVGGKNHDI